jgi:hypothetical protein|tara:strand:+ start:534 stop:707 length:174 start_codon:yes stop_codon:yes gene_type:complete
MEDYKEKLRVLNNAAWLAVRSCPYEYSNSEKLALIRIARTVDDIIDGFPKGDSNDNS